MDLKHKPDLIKEFDTDPETGEYRPVRWMTEDEIRERSELNIKNTASALRARVVAELAKMNGHGSSSENS